MSQINTQQLIQERFEEMTPEIQDIFAFNILATFLEKMAKRYDLTEEQQVLLGNDVALTLLLFLPHSKTTERITKSLNIPQEEAEAIVLDLHEDIFYLVKENLEIAEEKMFQEDTKDEPSVNTAQSKKPELRGYGTLRKKEPRDDTDVYVPASQDELLNKKQKDTPSYSSQ